ncbi:thioredoxin domain-containing protein [bacterium]|nr:thioredoxin domain-containing protein [bacterium]
MKNLWFVLSCVIIFTTVFFVDTTVFAELEWTEIGGFDLGAKPLDIVASRDGKVVFILTKGEILQFDPSSKTVTGRIPIGPRFDRVDLADESNTLVLSSTSEKMIKLISYEIVYQLDLSLLPYLGPDNAPVVIAVFSEYKCPYCARLSQLLEQVLTKYPDTVKLVVKHFPLQSHQFSLEAALAALAAGRQGKFGPFHKELYANAKVLNEEKLTEIAQKLGLNLDQFNKDRQDPALNDIVQRDIRDGRDLGIRGVPTVLINGKIFQISSEQGFMEAISQEIARKENK